MREGEELECEESKEEEEEKRKGGGGSRRQSTWRSSAAAAVSASAFAASRSQRAQMHSKQSLHEKRDSNMRSNNVSEVTSKRRHAV